MIQLFKWNFNEYWYFNSINQYARKLQHIKYKKKLQDSNFNSKWEILDLECSGSSSAWNLKKTNIKNINF